LIDVLYLAHNRLEFTKASLKALLENTDWGQARLLVYDDNSTDGTREFLERSLPVWASLTKGKYRSPVAVMNDYILKSNPSHGVGPQVFAKIDSDTMVPPGWLEESAAVMTRNPSLDFLGIEAHCVPSDGAVRPDRDYRECQHIGGIGLMRTRAFVTLPRPNNKFFGFTEFQLQLPQIQKGWIRPSLPVFLLDHLPREPWRSLSRDYIAKEWQREQWGPYPESVSDLWSWWCE
jgi:Glycosyltransferases, probably involved in cell wall biogenesis